MSVLEEFYHLPWREFALHRVTVELASDPSSLVILTYVGLDVIVNSDLVLDSVTYLRICPCTNEYDIKIRFENNPRLFLTLIRRCGKLKHFEMDSPERPDPFDVLEVLREKSQDSLEKLILNDFKWGEKTIEHGYFSFFPKLCHVEVETKSLDEFFSVILPLVPKDSKSRLRMKYYYWDDIDIDKYLYFLEHHLSPVLVNFRTLRIRINKLLGENPRTGAVIQKFIDDQSANFNTVGFRIRTPDKTEFHFFAVNRIWQRAKRNLVKIEKLIQLVSALHECKVPVTPCSDPNRWSLSSLEESVQSDLSKIELYCSGEKKNRVSAKLRRLRKRACYLFDLALPYGHILDYASVCDLSKFYKPKRK